MTTAVANTSSTRWKPTRCGLINLFRYDDETFHFSDGRLLLRGNNGTGKTRIMALTLPFLLDGSTHPSRVEPDGNRNRRIEWHLLMDKYHERCGYTWLEFQRIDEQGQELTCTLACGMKAQQGKQGLHSHWFMVSSKKVGKELPLKREDGTPWTKAESKEHLSHQGQIYERVEDYRRAVDEALFELGEHRYRSLVDLLIELRHPQLSRELNEERLTSALSDALPPLDSKVLDDVAEGYRSLEEDRLGLESVQAMKQAVDHFQDSYRDYLHVRVRLLCDDVRSQHSRYEKAQARVKLSQEQVEQAETELQNLESQRQELERRLEGLSGEERALQSSETMNSAERIQNLRKEHEQKEQLQEQLQKDLQRAQTLLEDRKLTLDKNKQSLTLAHQSLLSTHHQTLDLAQNVGAKTELERAGTQPDATAWARLMADLKSRQRSEQHLRQLQLKVVEAEQHQRVQEKLTHSSENNRDRCLESLENAEQNNKRSAEQLFNDIKDHHEQLKILNPPDEDLEALMADWIDHPQGPMPYFHHLETSKSRTLKNLSLKAGQLENQHRELEGQQKEWIQERDELLKGFDPPPKRPPWLQQNDGHQVGAALWSVCDFKEELSPQMRASLEAALESSQILNAWIFPEDQTQELKSGELSFFPKGPIAKNNLTRYLKASPSPESQLSEKDILNVLSRISIEADESLNIQADGVWQMGIVQGLWSKEQSEFIGAASRQAARLARIEAIEADLQKLDSSFASIQLEMESLKKQVRQAEIELDTCPDGEALRETWRQRKHRLEQLNQAQHELAQCQNRRMEAKQTREKLWQNFCENAKDCGLEQWTDKLDDLGPALTQYAQQLTQWQHLLERYLSEKNLCAEREQLHKEAEHQTNETQAREQQMSRLILGLQQELKALEENMGKAVEELLNKLSSVRKKLREASELNKNLEGQQRQAIEKKGKGLGALEQAQDQLKECEEQRKVVFDKMEDVARDGLLSGLGQDWSQALEEPISDTKVLNLARRLYKAFGDVDMSERRIDRISTTMAEANQKLQSSLSAHDVRPIIEERHGIWEVKVPFGGKDCNITELAESLNSEISTRHSTLTAKEREVIENFLIGEACDHIHGLLHESEEWLSQINAELGERPMSTGLTLRFRWQLNAEAPEGASEARQRLLKPLYQWNQNDRDILTSFLEGCIDHARETKPGHSWQDQLAFALDYRRWHRFVIERQQDGRWTRLTKRSHGTGSGGEKAIALTIPQFAAAAAHYRAAPTAPRLIMLDEAFVGIDNDMRRKCMGLLSAFDLDVVMTSEREWGCYDTVPGLSIYQLAADRTGECIATTRYVWNGNERLKENEHA